MDDLLQYLRAAGEATRLRLIALLAHCDLTVSELAQILGQSQPRVSRHLKLLTDVGLAYRYQEGSWAFYRLAESAPQAEVVATLVSWIPAGDGIVAADNRRLDRVRAARSAVAAEYFRRTAERWDRIRGLYVDEQQVEQAMLAIVGDERIGDLLDLGTGTGRVLEIFSTHIRRGLGIDLSREMLAVARAKLDHAGTRNCLVRHGDIYNLAVADASADLVTLHQILHYLHDPASAITEAARTLRRNGRIIIVDFAPHDCEFLRSEYAHRRLGLSDEDVKNWCASARLSDVGVQHLRPSGSSDTPQLTVSIWTATQTREMGAHYSMDVA
ncbi:MAG: metalloregulator ArsR/SmtB family transcription factor [Gammaproteobacteria bacterium]|nr:metalloregulator ArsR/SmtB family transcription factor [Gammaproteobacteria bacterium]